MFLLDTDTCIALLRGQETVVLRARQYSPAKLAISAITQYELLYGLEKCSPAWKEREQGKIFQLLAHLRILTFGSAEAAVAAENRALLEKTGQPIGPMDLLIAATALAADLLLVSNNVKKFKRVPNLKVETWSR